MEIKSWAQGVNRIILSETNIEVGTNAVQKDNSENGQEYSTLKSSGAPDRFSVTMMFSNAIDDQFYYNHVDSNGNHVTEWQAFLNWFKNVIHYGTIPFYFHKIDDPRGDLNSDPRACVYRIVSDGLPKGTPQGDWYKVTMTWVEYINEYIVVPEVEDVIDSIYISEGIIDVRFADVPESIPKKTSFSGKFSMKAYKDEPIVIHSVDYDGNKSAVLYIDPFVDSGIYDVTVTYNGKDIAGKYYIPEKD